MSIAATFIMVTLVINQYSTFGKILNMKEQTVFDLANKKALDKKFTFNNDTYYDGGPDDQRFFTINHTSYLYEIDDEDGN